MADKTVTGGGLNQDIPVKFHDNGDGTYSPTVYATIPGGGGSAVSISDGSDVAQGTTTDVAWVAGAGTVISLLKKIASAGGAAGVQYVEDTASAGGETGTLAMAIRQDTPISNQSADGDFSNLKTDQTGRLWTQVGASALPSGASTAAKQPAIGTAGVSSADVISVQGIASGTALPISATALPLPAGAATSAKQPALGTAGASSVDVISVQGIASGTPMPISGTIAVSGTMPVSVAVGQEVDGHSANIGALADAASASTLTGLLKNIKAALAGTLAISQVNPVQSATATLANVAGSATSVTLQALNTSRKGLIIVNDSTSILYVKFGTTASTTSYTYFLAGSVGGVPATLELPTMTYTGRVDGIWASATGNARVTELT